MAQVVIAVRGGPDAKSRCAGVLAADERAVLAELMLEDMLEAVVKAPSVTDVWVITPTGSIADLAEECGARVLHQTGDGLNRAFEQAITALSEHAPYTPIALLVGDLPALAASELEAAISLSKTHAVVLAPALADGGTGAIVLRAGTRLPMAFGDDSFERHAALARQANLSLAVVEATSLSLDIDRPEDLLAAIEAAPGTRTAAYLRERLEWTISS